MHNFSGFIALGRAELNRGRIILADHYGDRHCEYNQRKNTHVCVERPSMSHFSEITHMALLDWLSSL